VLLAGRAANAISVAIVVVVIAAAQQQPDEDARPAGDQEGQKQMRHGPALSLASFSFAITSSMSPST
jgi:hypothetical protein